LATLDKDIVEVKMGRVDNSTKEEIRTKIAKLTD
jgi:hypothetical protein